MKRLLILLVTLGSLTRPTPAQDGAPLIFRGRVWVSENGERRVPRGGAMQLKSHKGWQWHNKYEVSVVDGQFRQIVHPQAQVFELERVMLEGREALCSWKAEREVLGQPIELEARFLPPTRVRVRLQGSDAELDSCELLADYLPKSPQEFELPHPVPIWYAQDFDEPWQSRRIVRAHAPGSAWSSAHVDLEVGGDVWIDLVPQAELRVSVMVPPEVPQQLLRLVGTRDRFESAWRSLTHDGQLIEFDGLSEGAYAIETRSRQADVTPLSRRTVFHLCAGEIREVLLDLDALAAVPRVGVRGSLKLDASWPVLQEPPQLNLLRKDPITGAHGLELSLEARADASGAWSWDAGRLRVGSYAVLIEPYGSASELEIGAGFAPAALQVPPLFSQRLHFVDARTRRSLEVESLTWWPADLCRAAPAGRRRALDVDAGPQFVFEAPRGKLRIAVRAAGFRDMEFLIVPQRRDRPQEFALEPDCTVRVRLFDGERALELPSTQVLRIVQLQGAGNLPRRSLVDGAVLVRFEEAGTYAISADKFDGFASANPVHVEARLGETVDVVLRVERR